MGNSLHTHTHTHTHLAVFPPVLVLEFGGAALELRGSGLQGVGPVVQLRQLLVSLQNFVHVHTHDVDHLRDEHTCHRWSRYHAHTDVYCSGSETLQLSVITNITLYFDFLPLYSFI